jgi:hypothetical protein
MDKELNLEDIMQIFKNSDLSANLKQIPVIKEESSQKQQPNEEDASLHIVKKRQFVDLDLSKRTSDNESEDESENESDSVSEESPEE